jgi:acetolactate synthase I/II/III large subunit
MTGTPRTSSGPQEGRRDKPSKETPMRGKDNLRSAAEVLVDQLSIHGVRHVFCVPGESYLAVLDAFHDSDLAVTVCRQEGGAAMMAEAIGKVTGRPGVCFVTRGPGATNASHGIHIAKQDSTPLVLFVGQVARDMREREAFQELDYRAVFGSMTKWATEIDDPARVPEIVSRAFYTAANGRPGPVVVALPEDMLVERIAVGDAPPFAPIETSPGPAELEKFAQMLAAAKAPIILNGGSRWSQTACDQLARFAQKYSLPVATTFRRGHLFDQTHPCYAGDLGIGPNPKLLARIKAADLVIVLGGRLGELPSQAYTLFDIPRPQTTFVHVHPGAEELGRVYSPHLAINATPTAFAAALEKLEFARPPKGEAAAANADYREWTEKPTEQPGAVNFGAIMVWLRENLPADAILCNGAGNYAAWIHRFFRFRRFGQHIAPASGSMGYGVPAAVAMKRLYPERTVVCLAGDGDFLMNGQQRHVRHHPHAPGARISRPHLGDRIAQSGFPRLCARLRRLRRVGRTHRGFSRGVQGSAGLRQARDRAARNRSRSDYADDDDCENPRQVAGGKEVTIPA